MPLCQQLIISVFIKSLLSSLQPSKSELDAVLPKLKSIIVTGSKVRIGSQDSTEKHVTFQDSNEGSVKTKKVKFADDTVFEQARAKRGKVDNVEIDFQYLNNYRT